MSATPDQMKATMRLWASGVTVVTTASETQRAGTTVSSFTSVSLEPPLILVCLYQDIDLVSQIKANGYFAVSLLSESQADVSTQMAGFAELPEGEDRFYGLKTTTVETGAPVLTDAAGYFDCNLHAAYAGGTHQIIVGHVLATDRAGNEVQPLIYHDRAYRKLTDA